MPFRQRRILDKGFIKLDGIDGSDNTIVKEHVNFRFHIKCPLFVAHRWFLHNESLFTEINKAKDEFYVPAYYRTTVGKTQINNISETECNEIYSKIENFNNWARNFYTKLQETYGISQEQARIILPQSIYTEFYWTINVQHFFLF